MRSYVLILDIDDDLRRSLSKLLSGEGFEVIEEQDSGAGIGRVMRRSPGIVLLAEEMPPLEGIELLPLLRRLISSPILITGVGGEISIVKSLLYGADMYVSWSVNNRELLTRVRALVRRAESQLNGSAYEAGRIERARLLPEGLRSSLTDTEMRLFICLMEGYGRVVAHDELMRKVWGQTVKKGRLRFYIFSLRKKLESVQSISLHTQKGVGYRLLHSDSKV